MAKEGVGDWRALEVIEFEVGSGISRGGRGGILGSW